MSTVNDTASSFHLAGFPLLGAFFVVVGVVVFVRALSGRP
jgi:hypothetical protein